MKRRSCSNNTASLLTNKEESKLRSLLFVVFPFILTIILQIISYFAAFFLTFLFYKNASSKDTLPTIIDNGILLFIRSTLYLIVFGFWYTKFLMPDTGKRISKKSLILSFLAGAVTQVVFTALLHIAELLLPEIFSEYKENISTLIPSGVSGFSVFLVIFSVVMISPIAEEIIFRGVTQTYAHRLAGPAASVIVSALLFGLYHFDAIQAVYAGLAGLILGIIKEKTDSLMPAMLFHIAFNLVSYLILYFL